VKAKTYKIETERLVVRCYEPGDAFKLADAIAASLPELLPWIPWAKEGEEDEAAKMERVRWFRGRFDMGEDYTYGIFDKKNNFIGSTGLHVRIGPNAREIGYWISTEHTGKGYITEAVKALIKIAFDIEQMHRLEMHVNPLNTKSAKIPQTLGFTLEATLKKRYQLEGRPTGDTMIWTMFKEEYEHSYLKNTSIKAYDMVGREIPIFNT
jgi:RimJ/RimL family protein N-acetyltransferase